MNATHADTHVLLYHDLLAMLNTISSYILSVHASVIMIYLSVVFPNSCSLSLAAFSDKKEWELKIKYWENVYGETTYMYT